LGRRKVEIWNLTAQTARGRRREIVYYACRRPEGINGSAAISTYYMHAPGGNNAG
jgi:hypothetical protein